MLVYRARLPEDANRVVSVSVRTGRRAAGLGVGRLRTPCHVSIRYATADGWVRRHRGELLAALAPGVEVRVAACQFDGGEVLLSLRQVRGPGAGAGAGAGEGVRTGAEPPRPRAPEPPGTTLADRFALPFSLQAWGVTAVTGARVWLRLACRPRTGALSLRGTLRLALETSGGTLRLRVPFLRVLGAADLPDGLRWRTAWRVKQIQVRVDEGGLISGTLVLAVRCQGRPPRQLLAPAAQQRPTLESILEVTGQINSLTAEAAGPGCAIVRGAVDLDIYGVDARGASRWTGRSLPFAQLLAVADGDRLEATAAIERLGHGPAGIHVALALGVTALRTETVRLNGADYRAERLAGAAATTLVLHDAPGNQPTVTTRPAPQPGWIDMPISPAPPAPENQADCVHLPLPVPAHAVTALRIAEAGLVEALVTTSQGHLLIQGRIPVHRSRTTIAATAYPLMHGDGWQLRVIITAERNGYETW